MKTTIQLKSGTRKLNVTYWPSTKKVMGAVQIVHGASEHIDRYAPLALFLNEHGYDVYGHTLHGHGIDHAPVHFGFNGRNRLLSDCVIISNYLRARYKNYHILGHSMGSLIVRVMLSKGDIQASSIILSGTGYTSQTLSGVGSKFIFINRLFRGKKVSSRLNKFVFNFAHDWLACDPAVIEAYDNDPKCGNPFTISSLHTIVRLAHMSNKRKAFTIGEDAHILLISGLEDAFGGYGRGIKKVHRLYQKQNVDVRFILYPKMKHEILNDFDHLLVFDDVLEFIVANTTS